MSDSLPTPVDNYSVPRKAGASGQEKPRRSRTQSLLRGLSAVAACAAVASAGVVIVLDALHVFGMDKLPWGLKSAFPLIFIGVAYGSLQFTLTRTVKEYALGFCVAVAFILWGAEQFVSSRPAALLMDDLVALLFVMDLAIVVQGYLKQTT